MPYSKDRCVTTITLLFKWKLFPNVFQILLLFEKRNLALLLLLLLLHEISSISTCILFLFFPSITFVGVIFVSVLLNWI